METLKCVKKNKVTHVRVLKQLTNLFKRVFVLSVESAGQDTFKTDYDSNSDLTDKLFYMISIRLPLRKRLLLTNF